MEAEVPPASGSGLEATAMSSETGPGQQPKAPEAVDVFGGLTVGQVLAPGGPGCKLLLHYELGDVAESLAVSGQRAAAVSDDAGNLAGLLTENDIMRAFFEGASPDEPIRDWLMTGAARAPAPLLQRMTVWPSAPLAEVAERMVTNAAAGDCACHHVIVQEPDGKLCGVLSSHDLVTALCRPDIWDSDVLLPFRQDAGPAAVKPAADLTVQDIMKPRNTVFTCPPTSTMKDVLKVLLMTQQNSALIVDEEGIYGIVTPRDAVRAFEDGVPNSIGIAEWLCRLPFNVSSRIIPSDARPVDAAARMTSLDINHLIVVLPNSMMAVGVLSSLDLVLFTQARAPLLRSVPLWAGPPVGNLVGQPWHHDLRCEEGATFAEVAQLLTSTGATSVMVALSGEGQKRSLLTENDVLRASMDGWPRDAAIQGWLQAQEQRAKLPPHLLVSACVALTEAASWMLSASEPGRTCHHLVVQVADGEWRGIFSALDVARGLCGLCSELEVASTGADQTPVSAVMKPVATVPTCVPGDSLRDALVKLILSGQNAALVLDGDGFHGVITPRCALEALAEDVPFDRSVAAWLRSRKTCEGPRAIVPGTRLLEAAKLMMDQCVHHLVVMQLGSSTPVGVLSSLDLVRGVASINYHCPFVSLGWLRLCKGPAACTLHAA